MNNRASEEAQNKHQARSPNEQPKPGAFALKNAAGDIGDPAIGTQFHIANQCMQEDEEQKDRSSKLCEHRADFHTRNTGFGFGEFFAQHEGAINNCGY